MKKQKNRIIKGTNNKSALTRAKIITAAKNVFARLPYQAASMRMIGKEGV